MRIQIVMSLVGRLLYIFGIFTFKFLLYMVSYLKLHIGRFWYYWYFIWLRWTFILLWS